MRFRYIIAIFIFMCSLSSAQDFTVDVTDGCTPLTVQFSITSPSTVTSVVWDFGNGETSTELAPAAVTYDAPGRYTVTAEFNGSSTNKKEKVDYIKVNETVKADFNIEALGDYSYRFIPTSEIVTDTNDYAYRWEFSSPDTAGNKSLFVYDGDPQKAILDLENLAIGEYDFKLTTTNRGSTSNPLSEKCIDSVKQILSVELEEEPASAADSVYQAGNVFAPNSPGGEFYIIDPNDPSIILYFEVFTRSGVPIYKSEAPGVYWDGRTNNGRDLNTGVYFFILKSLQGDPNGFYNTTGFIHIFR